MVLVIFWIYVIDNQYCVVNNKTKTIQAKFNKFVQALEYIKQRSCLNFNSVPICIGNDDKQIIEKNENNNNDFKKNLLEKINLINENINNQILDNINIEKEILILKALFDKKQNIKNIQYSHFDNTLFDDDNLDFKIDNLKFDSFSNNSKIDNSNNKTEQVLLNEKENLKKKSSKSKSKKNKNIIVWILFSIMLICLLVTCTFYFIKSKNNNDIKINFSTSKINFNLVENLGDENQVINFNKDIKNLKLINNDSNINDRLKFNISYKTLIITAINKKEFFTSNNNDNIQKFSVEFNADNCNKKSKLEISIKYINQNSSIDWINEVTLLVFKYSDENFKKLKEKTIPYNKDIKNIELLNQNQDPDYSIFLESVEIIKANHSIKLSAKTLKPNDTTKFKKLKLQFKLSTDNNKEEEKPLIVNIFYINSYYLENFNSKFVVSKNKEKNNEFDKIEYKLPILNENKIKGFEYLNSEDELKEYSKYFSFPNKNELNEQVEKGTIFFIWTKKDHFDNIIKKAKDENKDEFTFKFYMAAKNVWNKAEITIDIVIGEIPKIDIDEKEILIRFNEEKIINYKIVDGIENERLKACIKEEQYKNKFNVNVEKDFIKIKLINDDYKEGAHLSLSYERAKTIDLKIKKINQIDLSKLINRIGMYRLDEGVKDITRLTPEDKKAIIWKFLKANEQYLKENNLILDEANKDEIINMLDIKKIGLYENKQELRVVDIEINKENKNNYFENKKENVLFYIKNIDLTKTQPATNAIIVKLEDHNDIIKIKKNILEWFVNANTTWLYITIDELDIVKNSAKNNDNNRYSIEIKGSEKAQFIEGKLKITIQQFKDKDENILKIDLEKLFNEKKY